VIAALGGPVTALAVKAATKTVPFAFITGVDPVKLGLVASFARPGGNATGVNMFITAIEAKRLGLLRELVPSAARVAVIVNPNSPELDSQLSDLQIALAQSDGSCKSCGWEAKQSLMLPSQLLASPRCKLFL
jgi:putative tryptophan/tyrosine transport system substrate-binding protein